MGGRSSRPTSTASRTAWGRASARRCTTTPAAIRSSPSSCCAALSARGRWCRTRPGGGSRQPGLDWERWPPQVEAVIAGHLAGLPDEDRALLQAASVQGEQFAAEVAARVLGWDEEAVVRRLSGPLRTRHRLVEAVSLERLASSGQRLSRYRFRHSLVQRSAYGSLDAVERARLHEATGRGPGSDRSATEERAEVRPGPALAPELARHYEAAGMPLEAARALHDAGRQAMRLSAFREALDRFDHGLALLADEPPSARAHGDRAAVGGCPAGPAAQPGWVRRRPAGGRPGARRRSGGGRRAGPAQVDDAPGGRTTPVREGAVRGCPRGGGADARSGDAMGRRGFVALAHWRFGFTLQRHGQARRKRRVTSIGYSPG